MRGLSSLSSSQHSRNKKSGLTSIQDKFYSLNQNSHFSKSFSPEFQQYKFRSASDNSSKSFFQCAYHVGERITNFCKNQNCLLPLCPKCIKIHSQQHQKMSMYGNFETIDQCLEQCSSQHKSNIFRLQQLVTITERLSVIHKQKMSICHQQLQKAKQQVLEYVEQIFQFYQQQTSKLIISLSKEYQEQIISFHKQIVTMLINQKQMIKKYQNNNLKLQFLIDSYSKKDLNHILNKYNQRIEEIVPKYVQISINTYQLERIKVILKKYLDFGPFNEYIQYSLLQNLSYQKITLLSPQRQQLIGQPSQYNRSGFNSNHQIPYQNNNYQNQKQFIRSPIKNLFTANISANRNSQREYVGQNSGVRNEQKYGFTQKGQISRMIQQRLNRQSKLDNFQSPLQNFSLQRSRRERNFVV